MTLSLRLANAGDQSACEEVIRDSKIYERYFSQEGALRRVIAAAIEAGQLHVAVAESGDVAGLMRVVPKGFCGLYPYLALLGTGKAYQGRGVARFLLAELERMGREQGARKVALLVSDFNREAQGMYEHCGYYTVGLIPEAAKPGIGEYLMLKDIV